MPIKTKEEIEELLKYPSDHKNPVEEVTMLDNKRRWFEQFIQSSPARNKEADKSNKVGNLAENKYSESNSSNPELNRSTASLSNSSSNVTKNLEARHKESDIFAQNLIKHSGIPKLVRSVSSLSNDTEKNSVNSNGQKSVIAHRKKYITSMLDNFSGDNHQLDRNFLYEVKLKYKLTPNLESVKPKVNFSHFSLALSGGKRNFIEENKKAVSSSMKR